MDFLEEIIWRFIHKFSLSVNYTFKVSKNAPWAYVSYVPEACYRKGVRFLNQHQNRRESKVLVEVLHELGFNVFVGQYNDTHNDLQKLPPPRLIFGLEPNFERACKLWPDAMKIYYATGAYYKHQNNMIRKRTDEFNLKYGAQYPYQRLATESDRCEKADYIF